MNTFFIGRRPIGPQHPPLIIAEIGINHGGDLDVAIEMADAAIDAGAEVIKHQTHVIEDEMSIEAKAITPGNANQTIFEIMSKCSLDEQRERKLMEYVQKRGCIFISTPFSRAAAERLKSFDVPAIKIGSGECNNYPLIEHVSEFGRPMIISTGMNSLDSIQRSVEIVRNKNIPFALLHCTNVYPTPPKLVRLGAMQELQEAFPDAIVGLSDHTTTNHACFAAVALGACIVERHFTDKMSREGPDISCSMDPVAFRDLQEGCLRIRLASGGKKEPTVDEAATIAFAFASVVATRKIVAGEYLTKENIWVKRPSGGDFAAQDYINLIGRQVCVDVPENTQIKKIQLAEPD